MFTEDQASMDTEEDLDFDQYRESIINESKREMETVIQSLTTTYKLELMKIPTDVKNSNWMEYYKKSINQGVEPLNVSNAINSCMDDSICTKVGVFLLFTFVAFFKTTNTTLNYLKICKIFYTYGIDVLEFF